MRLDKKIQLPPTVIDALKKAEMNYSGNKKKQGYTSLLNRLAKGYITLNNAKKIKHDYEQSDDTSKLLLGGQQMYDFVTKKLKQETNKTLGGKKAKERAGMSNAHRRTHEKNVNLSPLKENVKIILNETILKQLFI